MRWWKILRQQRRMINDYFTRFSGYVEKIIISFSLRRKRIFRRTFPRMFLRLLLILPPFIIREFLLHKTHIQRQNYSALRSERAVITPIGAEAEVLEIRTECVCFEYNELKL